jgi:hypothetical protein
MRHTSLFVLSLVSVAAVGCSGSSSGRSGSGSTASGSTAPFAVVTTTPGDGALDVPVADTLYITFSADVDPLSLAPGAILLVSDVGSVLTTVQATTPRVVSVTPAATLRGATSHLLRVTTLVTTTGGTALPVESLVRFTTSGTVPVVGPTTGVVPPATPGTITAGVAVADLTPGVGVPLAGFGGGDRRHTPLPDLNPFNDHTFLNPSVGILDPVLAKALVLDNGTERTCIVTLDAIATEGDMVVAAHQIAAAQGFSVPLEKVMVCSSHTHSGPGAMTTKLVWKVIAVDLFRRRVFDHVSNAIAQAMLDAERNLQPALIGVGTSQLTAATRNRRHADSPDLDVDDIDPEMIVVRVDKPDGTPIASVWNFAVHGTHFGASNLSYSADIMGSASIKAEAQGGGVCLFINGAEGDIKPTGSYDATGQLLADAILAARQSATTSPTAVLQSIHEIVDMGQPYIGIGLNTFNGTSANQSGFMAGLAALGINPQITFAFPNGWVDREFRYQAIRIGRTVLASMPGEPIHTIGLGIKADGHAMGFDHVIPAGLANGHGSYFTTPTEYGYGGYEAMASFFGPTNGDDLQANCHRLMDQLKP